MTMTDGQSVMLRLFIPYKLLHCQSGHLLGWHDVAAPYHEIKNGVRNVTTAIVWGISKIHVPEDCNSETVGELGIFECPKSPLKTWKSTINRHLFIHLIINDYGYIDITHLRLESRLLVPSKDCCIFLFEPRSYVSLMPEVLQNSTFRMGSQNDFYFRSGPFGDSTVHKRPDILSMFTVSLSQFRTSSISKYAEDSSQNFTRGNSGYQLETVVSHAIAQSILSILSHLAAHLNSITGFWIVMTALNFTSTFSTFATQVKTRTLQLQYLKNRTNGTQDSLRYWNTFGAIVMDIILGMVLTLVIHRSLSSTFMLDLFLDHTSVIVGNLRSLLVWLMGVPAGLKLNLPLSSAMGNFFLFHIYLWEAYLYIITPILEVMLDLSTYSGIFGLTFQLSMLHDLFALATFHIYCFYAYAARIYNIAILSLGSTWRIFRGKKWNPLRQRVDSCSYDVDQLFMGTLAFTILLFLLPTILLYYVVFTMLRLPVLVIQGVIYKLISSISRLPLYTMILYFVKSRVLIGSITLAIIAEHVSHDRPILFHVKENVCSFTLALFGFLPPMDDFRHKLSWSQFVTNLLTGRLIYPL